jgi:predicted Ser/Thr protein kinase
MSKGHSNLSGQEVLGSIDQAIRKEFDSNRRILSFDEFLVLLGENPEKQTRGSAQYVVDMMDHFGTEPIPQPLPQSEQSGQHGLQRFKLFDFPIDGIAAKVVGQEKVQNQIYRAFKAFARQGINNRLILLHGPNGSAKSSLIHAIMGGLERYSQESPGALYTLNWIFPLEKYTKGGIGIHTYAPNRSSTLTTYAKLPDEETAARIPCEMRDHPLLMVPQEHRKDFLEKLIGKKKSDQVWEHLPNYLKQGDLCHRCKQIYDALLTANSGDYKKVLMHVQVERIYFARRYRKGLVTIEPQMHVDAQYHQLTYNRSIGTLPVSLQSLNLFSLSGDLVDGNRGIVEYSDLLKRPVDSFKYLLSACETGSVNIGNSIAYLDSVMLGSTNEVQLDAFKEFPDFTSFKARIELIRVPYLLSASQEKEIYASQLPQMAGDKHISPHVAWTIGLWAVLTRLKKPNSINYPPNISALISNINPLEKARLYDTGEMPSSISPEDRKLLKASFRKLQDEYVNIPYYEGRMGASAREMKSVLFDAAQNSEFPCLSPLAVLREMEEFVKRITEYEFLKQDVKDGYHDSTEFIQIVRNEYLNRIDREVRDSIGLYDSSQWEDFLKKYVQQISLVIKKEKVKNPITGKLEDPDLALISEFEKIVDAPEEAQEKENFRQNIISQVGAWSLDHPKETVSYAHVFPDFWRKLEKHYFASQKKLLSKMSDALLVYDTDEHDSSSEGAILAQQTLENMKSKLGYCHACAKEVIIFLMKQRY